MFRIEPNAIYTIADMQKFKGENNGTQDEFSRQTVYKWFEKGLKYQTTAFGRCSTGRAILAFHEIEDQRKGVRVC